MRKLPQLIVEPVIVLQVTCRKDPCPVWPLVPETSVIVSDETGFAFVTIHRCGALLDGTAGGQFAMHCQRYVLGRTLTPPSTTAIGVVIGAPVNCAVTDKIP